MKAKHLTMLFLLVAITMLLTIPPIRREQYKAEHHKTRIIVRNVRGSVYMYSDTFFVKQVLTGYNDTDTNEAVVTYVLIRQY